MTDRRALIALAAAVLLSCGSVAARGIDHDEVLELRRSGTLLAFEKVVALISGRYPDSQILDVELEDEDGIYLYEIEILTSDKRIRELEIDARTGAILEDELDD